MNSKFINNLKKIRKNNNEEVKKLDKVFGIE